MRRRRLALVVVLGVLFGGGALAVHATALTDWNLYGVWTHTDSVAHFAAGVGVAAILAVGLDRLDWNFRAATAAILGLQVVIALAWEAWEALPRPYGLGYYQRFGNPVYVQDTTADVALVLVGAFLVVWLLGRYGGRF